MIPDLSVVGKDYPVFGFLEPSIRAWKEMPPIGGWAVEVLIGGFKRRFGGDPVKIAANILEAYQVRTPHVTEAEVWNFLNYTWTKRDPQRGLTFPLARDPAKLEGRKPWDFTKLSAEWLQSFAIRFSMEHWVKAVESISYMVDPANGLETADAEFFEALTKARIESTPRSEAEVKTWLSRIS